MTNDELQEHIRAIEEAVRNGEVEEDAGGSDQWRALDRSEMVFLNGPHRHRIKPKEMSLTQVKSKQWLDCTGFEDACEGVIRVRVIE